METKQEITDKRKEKTRIVVQKKNMVLQFLPSNFIFNQLPYFNAFSLWSLVQKRASNWPGIGLQTLSILQLCPCKLGQKSFSRQESLLSQ
jgi:hypothetical protein